MNNKTLGKIVYAEFGRYPERPFLFGLQLGFEFKGSGIFDGGRYTVNISDACRWERSEKLDALEEMINHTNKILADAKVDCVSQLIGKPVEVILENHTFKDFRILTEVL